MLLILPLYAQFYSKSLESLLLRIRFYRFIPLKCGDESSCDEPFLDFKMLNSLVILRCEVRDAHVFIILSETLARISICNTGSPLLILISDLILKIEAYFRNT